MLSASLSISLEEMMQNFGAKRARLYLAANGDEADLVDKIIAA
jgi:hypothetical protein